MGIVTEIFTPAEITVPENDTSVVSNNGNTDIIKDNQFGSRGTLLSKRLMICFGGK